MHSDGLRSGWDLSRLPGRDAARPARDRRAADPRLRARARRCERGGGARMSLPIADEVARVDLRHDEGVVTARQRARDVAELLGFDRLEQTRIATAVSELARNAHRYAGGGEVRIRCAPDALRGRGRSTPGPGSRTSTRSCAASTRRRTGLGRGLVGVRQLMDEFEIAAPAGRGTRVERGQAAAGRARRAGCARRARRARAGAARASPFDEVTRQNEELLQALGEVRARQKAMLALNRELEETNHGRRRALRGARRARGTPARRRRAQVALPGGHVATSCARR